MVAWWNAMSGTAQIFALIAIAATVLLLVQAVLLLIGIGGHGDLDGDGSADADTDLDTDTGFDADTDADFDTGDVPDGHDGIFEAHDHEISDGGLRVLSVRGIISFFAVAGWVGVIADKGGMPLYFTLPLAILCGFVIMVLLALMMKLLLGLQSDGTADIHNAVGVCGTVYLRVPANRAGKGKVNLLLQGAYKELEAVTDCDEEIGYGSPIIVVGVTGGDTLIVRKK